ncbi:MAG: hypothetical protein WDN76_00085 [Alphaproteobacteria bacterium]
MRNIILGLSALCLCALAACTTAGPAASGPDAKAAIAAALADPARPEVDKGRDAARKPAEMLEFAGISPGSKIAEYAPGGGYFTRIFAKAVGPTGKVYAAPFPGRNGAAPSVVAISRRRNVWRQHCGCTAGRQRYVHGRRKRSTWCGPRGTITISVWRSAGIRQRT